WIAWRHAKVCHIVAVRMVDVSRKLLHKRVDQRRGRGNVDKATVDLLSFEFHHFGGEPGQLRLFEGHRLSHVRRHYYRRLLAAATTCTLFAQLLDVVEFHFGWSAGGGEKACARQHVRQHV